MNISKSIFVIAFSVLSSNVYASENTHKDGGLMKEIMNRKHFIQVINDKVKQDRLKEIKIPDGSGDGGLAKEMYKRIYPDQVINDPRKQSRLSEIDLKDTN